MHVETGLTGFDNHLEDDAKSLEDVRDENHVWVPFVKEVLSRGKGARSLPRLTQSLKPLKGRSAEMKPDFWWASRSETP